MVQHSRCDQEACSEFSEADSHIWECGSSHLALSGSLWSLQALACTDQLATSLGSPCLEGTCWWLRPSSSGNWFSNQSNLGQRGQESLANFKVRSDCLRHFPAECWKSPRMRMDFTACLEQTVPVLKVMNVLSLNTGHAAFPMFYLVTITSCASVLHFSEESGCVSTTPFSPILSKLRSFPLTLCAVCSSPVFFLLHSLQFVDVSCTRMVGGFEIGQGTPAVVSWAPSRWDCLFDLPFLSRWSCMRGNLVSSQKHC